MAAAASAAPSVDLQSQVLKQINVMTSGAKEMDKIIKEMRLLLSNDLLTSDERTELHQHLNAIVVAHMSARKDMARLNAQLRRQTQVCTCRHIKLTRAVPTVAGAARKLQDVIKQACDMMGHPVDVVMTIPCMATCQVPQPPGRQAGDHR